MLRAMFRHSAAFYSPVNRVYLKSIFAEVQLLLVLEAEQN